MLWPVSRTAFALGVVGLVQVKKKPYIRGTAHAWTGIILGGLTSLLDIGSVFFLFRSKAAEG